MKVTFIHHSCFFVEMNEKVLVFDWFAGDRVRGIHFGGELPEYEAETPIYVFSSHKHRDHFDIDVLHWANRYKNIQYIFSKDCKMSSRFLERHGFAPEIREQILYVGANTSYSLGDLYIETFRSNDAGVAYYVETNGVTLFHAGDLNNWKWEGAGDLINWRMENSYQSQIKKLSGRKLHMAFVPLDPRLEEYRELGIDYFLRHTDAEYIFPMHMWQDYSAIPAFKKKIENAAMAERIVEVTGENQVFEIFA